MNTIVYILASHNFSVLPAQVMMLRKYVDDLSRIIVVQGPFGGDPHFSAGNRCLLDEQADALGVEIVEFESDAGGLQWLYRVSVIIEQAKRHAITQLERFAFVLHSDVLPVMPVNAPALLAEHHIAGRGRERIDGSDFQPTWTVYDTEAPELQHSYLLGAQLHGRVSAKTYPAYRFAADTAQQLGFVALEGSAAHRFEWCKPCWLHLDQVMISDIETMGRKVAAASTLLGIELPFYDPSVVIDGPLPVFKPRMACPQRKIALTPGKGTPSTPLTAEEQNVARYEVALRKWTDQGKPLRDDEDVDMIFERLCKPCDRRDGELCGGCGCGGLRGDEEVLRELLPEFDEEHPLRNKIRIGTEHCSSWKW